MWFSNKNFGIMQTIYMGNTTNKPAVHGEPGSWGPRERTRRRHACCAAFTARRDTGQSPPRGLCAFGSKGSYNGARCRMQSSKQSSKRPVKGLDVCKQMYRRKNMNVIGNAGLVDGGADIWTAKGDDGEPRGQEGELRCRGVGGGKQRGK